MNEGARLAVSMSMASTGEVSDGSQSVQPVRRRLIVVMGPIASGKSTLAADLANRLRNSGDSVAVVGIDTVAEMALPTLEDWTWALEVHGQVVGAWLATPMRTVIAEGPETPSEVDQLMRHVAGDVAILRVLLATRYETARTRTNADPARGISRDPDFLRRMYQRFEEGLPSLAFDLRLDSEQSAPGMLATQIIAVLEERHMS